MPYENYTIFRLVLKLSFCPLQNALCRLGKLGKNSEMVKKEALNLNNFKYAYTYSATQWILIYFIYPNFFWALTRENLPDQHLCYSVCGKYQI